MNKSRFAKSGDNCLIDLSTLFYQEIMPEQVDFSGCKINRGESLELLNYGRFGFLKELSYLDESALFLGQFGNSIHLTFDQYWECSQIGAQLANDHGRATSNQKISELGYAFTPQLLLDYVNSKNYRTVIFGAGELTVNADFTLDFLELLKLNSEIKLTIKLYTNGFVSTELLSAIKSAASPSINIQFLVWFYSTENEFWIKHTKRNLSGFYKGITNLQEAGLRFSFATIFIPDENDSDVQVNRLIQRMQGIYGETNQHTIEIHRFYPNYKVLDKESNTDADLQRVAKLFQQSGFSQVEVIDKPI